MNKTEAAKLLALIKVAYPTAYRDMDRETANATVNMWTMSFPDVPYPIMEQAFTHYRMVSKFPPTVAEMAGELKEIYLQALEGALVNKSLGNQEMVNQFKAIMACTGRYKNDEYLGRLDVQKLPGLLGGSYGEEENGPAQQGCHRGIEGRYELRQMEDPASAYR